MGPYARIVLRYGIGYLLGAEMGEALSMDEDLVNALAIAMMVMVEGAYAWAKKKGWAT
jgi:hypothetical protein